MRKFSIIFLALALSSASLNAKNVLTNNKQKNIIYILTDDLGFNDPSFRGNNEILTPNIDALFYKGINLNRYYTSPLCTPTRSAFLTGRYAHRIGMNHEVNWPQQPWGLGLDQKLFSQYLKEVGYSTHTIGKWHLGQHQRQYLPTRRGFDTFFGHIGPYVDYFDRTFKLPESNFPGNNYTKGYDFRDNEEIDRSDMGIYLTDLLRKRELTIDIIENSEKMNHSSFILHTLPCIELTTTILSQQNQKILSIITSFKILKEEDMLAMDDSIGDLVESLTVSGKMKDTIIVFTTDNGGPTAFRIVHPNTASNYPLRSCKGTAWEGAIRVDAAIYAPFLPSGVNRDSYFHVSDWLPTLATLANTGIEFDRELDGIDLSKMVVGNQGPYRSDVETIDQIYLTTSIIHDDFKLMNSSYAPLMGLVDVWLGSNNNSDREAGTYISRVLNSKVATNLKKYRGPLKENDIIRQRSDLKVTCSGEIDVVCNVLQKPCLFNIKTDPCERINLAENPDYAGILQDLKDRLATAVTKISAPRNKKGDFLSDPSLNNGVWTWWQPDFDV